MTSQDEFKEMITLVFKVLGVYQFFRMLSESKDVSVAIYNPAMFKGSWITHGSDRKWETRDWLTLFLYKYAETVPFNIFLWLINEI